MIENAAILTSKIIKKVSKTVGNSGSNIPGLIARKIDKDILKKIRDRVETLIFITGTNGKTATSQMVGHILEDYEIIHNKEGSNLVSGITTSFIDSQGIIKNKEIKYAVIEIDEGSIPKVIKEITPDIFLFTNLSNDQVDRFGTVDVLCESLSEVLPTEGVTYILNKNDFYVNKLKNKLENVIFYGLDDHYFNEEQADYDKELCQHCGYLSHTKESVNKKIGSVVKMSCQSGCQKDVKYSLNNHIVKGNVINSIEINNEKIMLSIPGEYNALNALAAFAICKEIGIPTETIQRKLERFKLGEGRMESFELGKSKILLNLCKNSEGVNNTLYQLSNKDNYAVFFALNNKPYDGVDKAWLKDIDFSELSKSNVTQIYCYGDLREDLKLVLEENLIPSKLVDDFKVELNELIENGDKVIVISNYTPMKPLRDWLAKESGMMSDKNRKGISYKYEWFSRFRN